MTTSAKLKSDPSGEIPLASGIIENQVHANLARLAAEFGGGTTESSATAEDALIGTINDIVRPETPAESCLAPALALFGWAGEGRLIREALPHFDRIENIEALRRVLCLLGYGTNGRFVRLSGIKPHALPCLFTRDGTDVTLIVERELDGTLLAFDGDAAAWKKIEPADQSGWAFSIWDQSVDIEGLEQGVSWLLAAIKQFRPTIVATLGLSLLGNVAALALPIFVIAVYDLGIGTKSANTIVMFAIGAGIVIATRSGAAQRPRASDGLFWCPDRCADRHEGIRSDPEYAGFNGRSCTGRYSDFTAETVRKYARFLYWNFGVICR